MNFKVFYMSEDRTLPYHLGRCINKGFEFAEGDIISIMDGDLLLKNTFLKELDELHLKRTKAIINIYRKMTPYPIGVPKEEWRNAIISFDECDKICNKIDKIPQYVSNKGPLISARKEYWSAVNYYDTHIIWSTGLSRLGQDVCSRLETFLNTKSFAMQKNYAIHPWHPRGFNRSAFNSFRFLELQREIIEWSKANGIYKIDTNDSRREFTDKLFLKHKKFILKTIFDQILANPGLADLETANSFSDKLFSGYRGIINRFHKIFKSK